MKITKRIQVLIATAGLFMGLTFGGLAQARPNPGLQYIIGVLGWAYGALGADSIGQVGGGAMNAGHEDLVAQYYDGVAFYHASVAFNVPN